LESNEKEVVIESDIEKEMEAFIKTIGQAQISELTRFRNDSEIKKIHLTLEDTKTLASIFDENRGEEWSENPLVLDHLITYLRQLKSVKNLVLMLRQLDNISCSLILILADEIRMEYLNNLTEGLKSYLQNWYDDFIDTVCDM
jgi:hypothetical protein